MEDQDHVLDEKGEFHLKEEEGRAGARTTIFKGFFSSDSHQNINSFVWGPGGEMMFCQGLHLFSHVETPWGVEKLDKAGVWRMREKRGRLDPFLGDDMGPQNPYGVVFDDYGRVAGASRAVDEFWLMSQARFVAESDATIASS